MELTKKIAKENLSKLIEKFEKEKFSGRIQEYNEEATKISFIQPLLKDVLGWDVNDHNEVSPEERVSRGRVDYGLKVDGKVKIFIEVKPVKADLNKHIEQAVRYGYNRKDVPFVLLTDFEGVKLFDVTIKPDLRNPLKCLKIDLQWNQYLQQFNRLWVFSKESVIQGELDKLLLIKPKEKLPVDKAILDDLKKWREALARNIFKNNLKLFHSGDQEKGFHYLKEINQRILDRIIFMRSCEDRNLIHRQPLKELFEQRTESVGTNTMLFLKEEFKHYDIIFDSDLFRPQEWENNLAIDFKVMKNIVLETYDPYQFDVIPLEVLGNIYEQYLGYTVKLTDQYVKYELKPDVRKAGGVYYTPEYIVDYIVKSTVGELLQKLSPKKIKKLRILDPACGSGSFLIRAYEEMLNYYKSHRKQQRKSAVEQEKLDLKHEKTEPRLTIHEKSQILLNHIFGVDIDEQAVEVTKLSLMLKMLEGEYSFVPGRAILPMLDRNIRCGNSLISGGTLELKKHFGDDWYMSKPFNWDEQFEKIMIREKGFDVVIGNPPYISYYSRQAIPLKRSLENYYRNCYEFLSSESKKCRLHSVMFFLEKGVHLLRPKGKFSMIIDLNIHDFVFKPIRKYLLNKVDIKQIVNNVFAFEEIGSGQTIISFIKNYSKQNKVRIKEEFDLDEYEIEQRKLNNPETDYAFNISRMDSILDKIEKNSVSLENLVKINTGVAVNATEEGKKKFIFNIRMGSNFYPLLEGGKSIIHPYCAYKFSKYLKFDKKMETLLNNQFEKKYLKEKGSHQRPFNIREKDEYNRPKFFLRQSDIRLTATFIDDFVFGNYSLFNIYDESNDIKKLKYLLGLINSKVLTRYAIEKQIILIRKGKNPQIRSGQRGPKGIRQLPIRKIRVEIKADKKLYNNLVALVNVMLVLNKKIQTAKGNERDQIQKQIEKTDREIDNIVYKLYNLTEEEIKAVESA